MTIAFPSSIHGPTCRLNVSTTVSRRETTFEPVNGKQLHIIASIRIFKIHVMTPKYRHLKNADQDVWPRKFKYKLKWSEFDQELNWLGRSNWSSARLRKQKRAFGPNYSLRTIPFYSVEKSLLTAADRNKIVRCRPKPSFYAGHFPSLTMREVIYFWKPLSHSLVQNFLVILGVFSVLL